MHIREYLPSTQFAFLVGSVALALGLVFIADTITSPNPSQGGVVTSDSSIYTSASNANWAETLRQIQAQYQGSAIPQAPSIASTQSIVDAAQDKNITNSIARALLVNLSEAKFQGLGNDIPTQDKLVAEAAAKIESERGAPLYTEANLTLIEANKSAWHSYGNAVMTILLAHPKANFNETLLAIGYAVDTHDAKKLAPLTDISREYAAIAKELAAIPTPKTISPLHLGVVNNFARIAQTYDDMRLLVEDPLRGLAGLQMYQSLVKEVARVFTTIAVELRKNGILFETSEPGNSWSFFLSN